MGRFSQKLDNLSMRRPGFICAQCAGSRERAISEPVKGPEPLARRRARQGRLPATAINTAVDKNVWSCPSRVGSATAITLDTWPNSLAWFAADGPRVPITCDFAQHPALGRKVSDEFTVPRHD